MKSSRRLFPMNLTKENILADSCINCKFCDFCFSNIDSCIKRIFDDVLATLTPREEETLKLLYGYNSEQLNEDEVAEHFNITVNRISQIEAKALRKLRHPSRSKKLYPFVFEALSSGWEDFHALLVSKMWEESSFYSKILYGVRLGIDFSLVYEQNSAKKTPAKIKEELSSNVCELLELSEYSLYLQKTDIKTLMQLLHTSRKKLLFDVFDGNDITYFQFIDKLTQMGYKIKDEYQEDEIYSLLINNLYQTIAPEEIYKQPLINLPLEIIFLLIEQNVSTIGELLSNLHSIRQSPTFTKNHISIIEDFLVSKKLVYKFNNGTLLYLTSTGADFCNQLIRWMIKNNFSILALQNELQVKRLHFADAIQYIAEKYTNFEYVDPYISITNSDTLIEELGFSTRTFLYLKRLGIDKVGDFSLITSRNVEMVTRIRNTGSKSVFQEIITVLNKYNLNSHEITNVVNLLIASEEIPDEED